MRDLIDTPRIASVRRREAREALGVRSLLALHAIGFFKQSIVTSVKKNKNLRPTQLERVHKIVAHMDGFRIRAEVEKRIHSKTRLSMTQLQAMSLDQLKHYL